MDNSGHEIHTATNATNLLLGQYELGKLVGSGAFGKVYHARNLESGQSVAIKSVSKHKVVKTGHVAGIKREITIMRRLNHPNIIRLHEVLATSTKVHFVMDFAKGGELFAKVSNTGRLCEDLSRRYFRQLISAVAYCHSHGVFHRDLKLENLLLDDDSNLKVSDFGLSAVRDQVRPDGRLHTLCGTPAYVAPEILAKKGYDGAKVDIWSCGVVLFVLAAGYLPFNDTNLMALYRKIYRGQFRIPKWTSPDLKRLLLRLLDTNPETRITVDEILADPWFNGGYEALFLDRLTANPAKLGQGGENGSEGIVCGCRYLNAFDLISCSPGFNLTGLFPEASRDREEVFVAAVTPEMVMERVEEAATAVEGTVVRKKRNKEGWGVSVEGQNGDFRMSVEVHRLTEELVVVVVGMREKDVGTIHGIWRENIRPTIIGLG